MTALVAGGWVDDTGDMTTRSKDETHVFSDQILRTVSRFPWDDVVLTRGKQIERQFDRGQVDRYAALRRPSGRLDIVFEICVARVPTVHRAGQADAVGIPIQQIEGVRRRALEVTVDDVTPDQIVGAQRAESKRQFLARQNTTFPDRRFP